MEEILAYWTRGEEEAPQDPRLQAEGTTAEGSPTNCHITGCLSESSPRWTMSLNPWGNEGRNPL